MLISFPTPRRAEGAELIDAATADSDDFRATFADIALVNRFLGGTRALLSALTPLARSLPQGAPLRILDVATGTADIPRAIARAARRGSFGPGRRVEVIATDYHPTVLALARSATPLSEYPEIKIAQADAFALPFENHAFDIALCSLAFHHFSSDESIRALREMERVAARGWIVSDLVRDRLAAHLMTMLCVVLRAHPYTAHDGPLSVLRSLTIPEYREMADRAGFPDAVIRTAPMYRALIVRDKAKTAAPSK